MKEKDLETYLQKHIPLTQALGIKVESASANQVILFAPFANNINHQSTIFGGSLHAVLTLACWSLLHMRLQEIIDERFQIVITKSHVSYDWPVDADFRAQCLAPSPEIWQSFLKMLKSKGKARLELSATVTHKDKVCVHYAGTFAAKCA